MNKEIQTGVIGRLSRIVLEVSLIVTALTYYLYPITPIEFLVFAYHSNLQSIMIAIGGVVALIALFSIIHYIVSRFFINMNTWLGTTLATLIPVIVFIFLSGAGRIAVLTFIGISLMLASV